MVNHYNHRLSSTKEGTATEGMVSVQEEGMNEDLIGITAILRVAPAHLVCCLSLFSHHCSVRRQACPLQGSSSLGLYSLQSVWATPHYTALCTTVLCTRLSTMVPQSILTPAYRDNKNDEIFIIYGDLTFPFPTEKILKI